MQAIAIDGFGGIEQMTPHELPIPELDPNDVLIRVECAGIGEWDPFEREGGFAGMTGTKPSFPYVLGSDGAGVIAGVGSNVKDFEKGDRVYAIGLVNPKGGFYAQYAALDASLVSPLPEKLSTEQGAVMPEVAITALRGIDDVLGIRPGESVLVFGASGGLGHIAVQLAKLKGARVLAVASGEDGVALAKRVGADAAVEGHRGDVLAAARAFAPEGLDAALLAASGDSAERALDAMRDGGRVAYPNGVQPPPRARPNLQMRSYDGDPDHEIIQRLNELIASGPFDVCVSRVFDFDDVASAHRAIQGHHIGKLALRIP